MTDTGGRSACTVRITVKLRPDEYDELFRHVHEIGSTMSAFFRESAAKAMKGKQAGIMDLSRRRGGNTEGRDPGGIAAACLFEPGQHEMTTLELSTDAAQGRER